MRARTRNTRNSFYHVVLQLASPCRRGRRRTAQRDTSIIFSGMKVHETSTLNHTSIARECWMHGLMPLMGGLSRWIRRGGHDWARARVDAHTWTQFCVLLSWQMNRQHFFPPSTNSVGCGATEVTKLALLLSNQGSLPATHTQPVTTTVCGSRGTRRTCAIELPYGIKPWHN